MTRMHLIYQPGDLSEGTTDNVLDIIETDDPNDVLLGIKANPGAIAMQLDAETPEDLPYELQQLGF